VAELNETLADRKATHGDFRDNAQIAQEIKRVYKSSPAWPHLAPIQREALEMIASKQARILSSVSGAYHADNWHDIAGYTTLVDRVLNAVPTPKETA
jgi:hypothetical protein